MGNKTYNTLKWTALILLPALGALYFGLGQLWHFPKIEEVVGSVTVLETFIGLILRKSAVNYGTAKTIGDVVVMQDSEDGTPIGLRFVVDSEPNPVVLNDQKVVQFKVTREQGPAA